MLGELGQPYVTSWSDFRPAENKSVYLLAVNPMG
jgi:hypothetical protein